MKPSKAPKKKKAPGVYMYCDDAMKKRIDRARRFTNRTLTGYLTEAVERLLEVDEAAMAKKQKR